MNKYDSVIRTSKIDIVSHFSSQMARTFQISNLSHSFKSADVSVCFLLHHLNVGVVTLEVITCG
jgi:hypothetical protein